MGKKPKAQDKTQDNQALINELTSQYKAAEDYLKASRDNSSFTWEDREKMASGLLVSLSKNRTKSQVNTNILMNLVLDQTARSVAQMPTGSVQAVSGADKGTSYYWQLVLEKYILKNANTQWDFLTKLRIVDMYSHIYGTMPALINWVQRDDYVGPDLEVLHPRNVRIQANKYSIEDADYCFVDSKVNIKFLEGLSKREDDVYDKSAIEELIAKAKDKSDTLSTTNQSYEQQQANASNSTQEGDYSEVVLTTRYERDKWIVYSQDYKIIIRQSDNPYDDGELPIIMKYTYPLIDRIHGLGIFERGKSTELAMNSLLNMHLDASLYSIIPPTVIDKTGVVMSSLKREPGAWWITTKPNAITNMPINPAGMNTFQATFNLLNANLLKMAASTDTSVSKEVDVGMGKTPKALEMQNALQGARDNWDRGMLEKFVEKAYNKMVNLLSQRQEKNIPVEIFKEDIRKIKELYPTANMKAFDSDEYGILNVPKSKNKTPVKFRFYIQPGSTLRKDEAGQNETVQNLLTTYFQNPQIKEELAAAGKKLDIAYLYGQFIKTSGLDDSEKVIVDSQNPEVNNPNIPPADPNAPMTDQVDPNVIPPEAMSIDPNQVNQNVPNIINTA
jgi:hypothetical protein